MNSDSNKIDITKEHSFKSSNIIETSDIKYDKDYFEYDVNDKERYSFLNFQNFLYSKQLIKSFYWSLGIGATFVLHRYVRTRSLKSGLKWGMGTMFSSCLFIWGTYEAQPFMNNYFQTKELETKSKQKLMENVYILYKEEISKLNSDLTKKQQSSFPLEIERVNILSNKNSESNSSLNSNNSNSDSYNPKIHSNSDYYARFYLKSVLDQIQYFGISNKRLKKINRKSLDDIIHNINFNRFVKIKFSYNPYSDSEIEIDEEMGLDDEEEFYLDDLSDMRENKKKYKIVSLWIDYDKMLQFINFDVKFNFTYKTKIFTENEDILSTTDENLSADMYNLKLLITSQISKNNVDNKYYPSISDEEYFKQSLDFAKEYLEKYDSKDMSYLNKYNNYKNVIF